MTDAEMVSAFAAYQRLRNLSPRTTKRVVLIVWAFQRDRAKPLLEMTRKDIEEWLESRNVVARTRSSYTSYLASFYTWAVREELTDTDPTRGVVRPRLPRTLPRPIADADLDLAIEAADDRMRVWLCLAAYEGMRVAEIASLAAEDVFLEREPPMLRVTHAKGNKERMLPIHPKTAIALRALNPPRRGYLFIGACEHHAIQPGTVTKYVTRFLRGLGMSDTAHSLRHWFGTEAYRRSHDLRLVQELLGHASPTTTAGYAAFSPGAAVDVVRHLGERLQSLNTNGSSPTAVVTWLLAAVLTHPLPHTPW